MDLHLRYREAVQPTYDLTCDKRVVVASVEEWRSHVYDPSVISSVLWPSPPLFDFGSSFKTRRHQHEVDYCHQSARNRSFRDAARRLAGTLQDTCKGRVLVYAPLRGALPIWRAVSQFFRSSDVEVYYPVTSSFVMYPEEFDIRNSKGKFASGRYNNIQELERLRPFLSNYDVLLYIDEIVSGGMMWGHVKEMIRLNIDSHVSIVTAGIADRFGERSSSNRKRLQAQVSKGRLRAFLWEGCESLITEDQKFLLGIHYLSYKLGPHVIPVLDENLEWFEEKRLFDAEVMPFQVQP